VSAPAGRLRPLARPTRACAARVPASRDPALPDLGPDAAPGTRGRIAATSKVLPRLKLLRSQPVHNDFNSRNLLVDPEDETRITGIIDFGDLVHTALVADIAVGVIGQLATAQTADEAMLEFVGGYRAVEPLQTEELEMLKWLIAARIVQNVSRSPSA
jgi:hydroxylysine kinase